MKDKSSRLIQPQCTKYGYTLRDERHEYKTIEHGKHITK
jgi:hypothetical protein